MTENPDEGNAPACERDVAYAALLLADFVRFSMRDSLSKHYGMYTFKSFDRIMAWLFLIQKFDYSSIEKSIYQSVRLLRTETDPDKDLFYHTARMGSRLMIEKSCDDPQAPERIAKWDEDFRTALKDLQNAQAEGRESFPPRKSRLP